MIGAAMNHFANTLLKDRTARSMLLPLIPESAAFADSLLGILFPHFSGIVYHSADEVEGALHVAKRDVREILRPLESEMTGTVEATTQKFFEAVPDIYDRLGQDARAIYDGDPAAESLDEVVSAYPGFLAIAFYRIAHEFCTLGVPLFPRILSEIAHQRTGIDIHPGAQIGRSLCIDHGTGIVIGETALIGDHVKIYQGVTLGALSVKKNQCSAKRHPTLEDRTVVYSNATILGGETVIGHDSVIGGNVWLTESVPPFSVVYHRSEIKVRDAREKVEIVDFVI
jgi:serine O-acetyltransferase